MSTTAKLSIHQPNHRRRIKAALSLMRAQHSSSALVLSSAAYIPSSRDQYYPFRQSSDFYYLTGSLGQDLILLLSTTHPRPRIFAPKVDTSKVLWEGSGPNLKKLTDHLGAELVIASSPVDEVLKNLRGHEQLFFQNERGSKGWAIAEKLVSLPSHQRASLPARFTHVDMITEPLRILKDKHELKLIRQAAAISNYVLFELSDAIEPGRSEREIANFIEASFQDLGVTPSFSTIVAAGKSAATLHHHPSAKKLKASDLVLIDMGAQRDMYCADITRTFPVRGPFPSPQRDVYEIVLAAQKAAIKTVRSGVNIENVHESAARVLTEGLKDLKVLRGKTSKLLSDKAYRPYFPHSIGHTLGIDIHDIGNLRGGSGKLLAGMVITIEPGLYFPKKIGRIPPLGIRIEDDVLVTKRGSEVLSEGFPKEVSEIEAMR